MPTYTEIICKFCNNPFNALPYQKGKLFCDNECYRSFKFANKLTGLTHCACCDKKLSNGQYKFCSCSCSAKYSNSNKSNDKRKHPKIECIICKNITTNPKYCCKKCANKGQIKYHSEEERLHIKRMRGREATARYAARQKYQTPCDENLAAIKLFYKNCPVGYEVDHIIPISKGGHHSLENLQYLTVSDNRRKSAKLNWNP